MRSLRSAQSLVIVAGYALGAFALYWGLPEQVPPSWTVPGRGTVWLGAPMVAFLLPTAVAITDVLLRGLCVNHPIQEPSSMDVLTIYDAIMLRFSLSSSAFTERCSSRYSACYPVASGRRKSCR